MSLPVCLDVEVRPIPGFPGYNVSADGRIYGRYGRVLRPRPKDTGHLYIDAGQGCATSNLGVHRAVLLAWVGPCPQGYEARHLDGDPSNNYLSNLAWGTRTENNLDRIQHGLVHPRGEANAAAKLTEDQVREIRSMSGTMSWPQLGRRFGVSKTAIGFIIKRRTWTHVGEQEVSA